MSNFWDDIVRKFTSGEDVINIPGAPIITNKYIDSLQRRVLIPQLSRFKGKTFLDVGTGIGRWGSQLAGKSCYVIGIDISREMIRVAKRNVNSPNVNFVVATAYAIPLRSNSIDLSLSCTCIQHIVDEDKQQQGLHEVVRVTRNKILILELMSKSKKTKLTHYPTLIIPRYQYVSALRLPWIESITDIGVDFLPFVKLTESLRNFLLVKLGIDVPSYGGSRKQQLLRKSYQMISVFFLFFSLPFSKLVTNPSSSLTRHTLLIARVRRCT